MVKEWNIDRRYSVKREIDYETYFRQGNVRLKKTEKINSTQKTVSKVKLSTNNNRILTNSAIQNVKRDKRHEKFPALSDNNLVIVRKTNRKVLISYFYY